jgi:hypothetical protein
MNVQFVLQSPCSGPVSARTFQPQGSCSAERTRHAERAGEPTAEVQGKIKGRGTIGRATPWLHEGCRGTRPELTGAVGVPRQAGLAVAP